MRYFHLEQFGVTATEGGEFGMGAIFDNLTVFKYEDRIRQAHSAETVADENGALLS